MVTIVDVESCIGAGASIMQVDPEHLQYRIVSYRGVDDDDVSMRERLKDEARAPFI